MTFYEDSLSSMVSKNCQIVTLKWGKPCDKNFYFFGVVIQLDIAFAYRNLKPVVSGHHVSFVSFPLDLYRTPDSLQQDTEANYGTKWIQSALR